METKLKKTEIRENKWANKNMLSVIIRLIISVTILYFIISLVQWENVLSAYKTADSRYIFLGGSILFLNIGIRTYKWHMMLKSVKFNPTYYEAFGSLMLGISLGSFTPGEIGEYAGRALHISNAKRSHLIGLSLLDKYQIFIVTSSIGLICLLFITTTNIFVLSLFTALIAVLFIFLIFRTDVLVRYGHKINASLIKRYMITNVLDGFTLLIRKQMLLTLLPTILFHLIIVLQMFCILNAFYEVTILQAFIGTSIMLFVKSCLPISIGDLGIREASSIFFFSMFKIPDAVSLNASLLLFVINILIPGIIGIYFFRYQQFPRSIFKQLLRKGDPTTK